MTDPITPPPELVEKWAIEYWGHPKRLVSENEKHIATQAAQWGYQQAVEELEAFLRKDHDKG
jgi:hypothetical protein